MFPPNWPKNSDWTKRLESALNSPEFQSLQDFVAAERKQYSVFPPTSEVFNAFRFTPFSETKVVILGQDPYHGAGQAHGLSFSVQGDCKIPPSLRNIFKELASDLENTARTNGELTSTAVGVQPLGAQAQRTSHRNGDLTSWAEQGVLLLNTVLTVRSGEANSHARRGWESFTDQVIQKLGQRIDREIVFLLWGKSAQKKSRLISPKHKILAAPHPSPLSAHRGFLGSRPFSSANQTLVTSGQSPVEWG